MFQKLSTYFFNISHFLYYQDILLFFVKIHFFAITYYNYYLKEELLILTIFFFIINLIKLKLENISYQNINHHLLLEYKDISNKLNDYRLFKHNIYANLLSLKYQKENLSSAIDTILQKYTNKKSFPSPNLTIIEDFIYNHICEYENLNIKINVTLEDKIIQDIACKKYLNFFETLSILINNACEAALDTNKKLFYLEAYLEDNYLIISIINTFSNTIDIESFGNLNYSTKKRKSGLGIYGALKNNPNLKFRILDDVFISEYKITI